VNLEGLLDLWTSPSKFETQTVLERVIGRSTAPAAAALAVQGKSIVTVVDADASTERVRAVYGLKADVRIAGNDDVILPKSDLVLIHGGALGGDWRSALTSLAKHATKLVIVAVENPLAWQAQSHALLRRLTGGKATNGTNGNGGWGKTAELAPVLWELGRVREHLFLDVPPFGSTSPLASRLGPRLASRLAPQHAFVVDVTPRSPQARRRLRLGA
jgi:hypothetical protein